jgi:hypothetical protein
MCGRIKDKSLANYAEEIDEEYFYLQPLSSASSSIKTLTIPAELRVLTTIQ